MSESNKSVINDNTLANAVKDDIKRLLLDRINPDFGLLDVLRGKKTLNRNECQDVKSRRTTYDKNVRLLEIITEKQKLWEFFEALRDSKQEHLVNYATANGERPEQCSGIWPLTSWEINVLEANHQHLVEHIDVSNNELVTELYMAGFLDKRQKDHVCKLVQDDEKVEALLDILHHSTLSNYCKMKICLSKTNQNHNAWILEKGSVNKKEEEEMEQEEAKKQMIEHSSEKEYESPEEEELVGKTKALQTYKFVQTDFQILAAIPRSNFDYFVEFMVPKVLINRLHAKECLTDNEMIYIKTLRSDRDKSHEIIRVIRGVPSKYNVFVDILREKEQYRLAEVADRGGAVMKVSITFGKQINSADIQQKLYDRIQSLLSKTSPFSLEVMQVLSLLARAGVEIIRAKNLRCLSLWLWCRSEYALQKFNEMNESSNELSRFFGEFFALLDINDQIPPIMNIDLDDPDRDVVLRPSGFTSVNKLAVGQHSVCAVTSHKNIIYALSRNPTAILVFTVDNPRSIRCETLVPDIKDPGDMVVINELVFVSDRENSCIWQMTVVPYQAKSWPVVAPYTMSVLQGCNILKASCGQPSTLNIYDQDFIQVNEISLPLNIKFPCHAIGTLANTFIVSYKEEASPSGGLCEVNSSGDVLSIFDIRLQAVQGVGATMNQSLSRLIRRDGLKGYPEHFTLNERDEIFATDRSKSGILVYNSRLVLEDILEKDSIKIPSFIHYVMNSKLLLVVVDGEGNYSKVVILKQRRAL